MGKELPPSLPLQPGHNADLAAFHVEVKTNAVGLGFLGLVCFSLCCLFVIEHFVWLQHWQTAGATGPSSSRGQRLS